MTKIYCKYCKYYAIVTPGKIHGTSAQDACNYKDNCATFKYPNSSYELEHVEVTGYYRPAHEINYDNKCKWFEESHPED